MAGIKFGAVVIDTCSSPRVAAERLAQYLDEEANTIIGHIAMGKADPEAERVISELSTALNMSAVVHLNHDEGKISSQTPSVIEQQSRDGEVTLERPPSSANFKRAWGVLTSIASTFGVLIVLVCTVYFLMVFKGSSVFRYLTLANCNFTSVTVGTTILGYFILTGLLMLYSVNFAFVLPPSMGVCWMRRLGMSIAYCTILAGM